jgi:two-component system response regulator CpxR
MPAGRASSAQGRSRRSLCLLPEDSLERRRGPRTLRARRAADRRRAGRRSEAPAPAHGVGILIVEDDADSRDILRDFLQAHGYPVLTAKHGREALDYLRGFAAPCLILLDLRMPVMDGWTFRRELLADPLLATISVVAVSAEHPVERARWELPFAGYFEKPVDFAALLRTVQQYC